MSTSQAFQAKFMLGPKPLIFRVLLWFCNAHYAGIQEESAGCAHHYPSMQSLAFETAWIFMLTRIASSSKADVCSLNPFYTDFKLGARKACLAFDFRGSDPFLSFLLCHSRNFFQAFFSFGNFAEVHQKRIQINQKPPILYRPRKMCTSI